MKLLNFDLLKFAGEHKRTRKGEFSMTNTELAGLQKTLATAHEAIENFKKFVESLNGFMERNQIGFCNFSREYPATTNTSGKHGFDIAMVHITGVDEKDLLYMYVYTDGTVEGEILDLAANNGEIAEGTSFVVAARLMLRTVGVLISTVSKADIEKLQNALDALK